MSRSRNFGSFVRHRRKMRTRYGGVLAGNRSQSGSPAITASSASVTVVPVNGGCCAHILNSTQPNAQMSVRLSTASPPSLLRAHVTRGSDDHTDLRRMPRAARRPHRRGTDLRAIDFREPEVEDLDVSVGRDLDVAGLEITMDDAAIVRRLQPIGQLTRDPKDLIERDWTGG